MIPMALLMAPLHSLGKDALNKVQHYCNVIVPYYDNLILIYSVYEITSVCLIQVCVHIYILDTIYCYAVIGLMHLLGVY